MNYEIDKAETRGKGTKELGQGAGVAGRGAGGMSHPALGRGVVGSIRSRAAISYRLSAKI